MGQTLQRPATLDELQGVEGKAELIAGRIVRFMSSGVTPSQVAFKIAASLDAHGEATKIGLAFADGIGYAIDPPLNNGRQSFSPDASFHLGPLPANRMRFISGAPTFAVEVRSESDYVPLALAEMADKRADYFEAGTLIVWDVDPIAKLIDAYRGDPVVPVARFGPGDVAEADLAVPGWRLVVDHLFT